MNFGSGLGMESGKDPGRNGDSMVAPPLEWTDFLDFLPDFRPGGTDRQRRRQALGMACQDANSSPKTPRDAHRCRRLIQLEEMNTSVLGPQPKIQVQSPSKTTNQGFGPDALILKCSNWISRRHHEHRGVFLGSEFAS